MAPDAERPLPDDVRAWQRRGATATLAGHEVFFVDTGPATSPEAVVVLHGFSTSSHDWHRAIDHFGPDRRVVLFDFVGFGLSSKPIEFIYSLMEQTDLALMLLRERGVRQAHFVAHDMGTSVACELVARRERGLLGVEMLSLVLMNGSIHIELSQLTLSQKLLRSPLAPIVAKRGSARVFKLQMSRILGRPISERELDAMWAQLAYRGGRYLLPKLIGYVDERYKFWHRWVGALTRLDVPTLVLWGPEDTVAIMPIAEKLAGEIPGARLERLEGLGHYPMVEDAATTGRAIARFLDTVG